MASNSEFDDLERRLKRCDLTPHSDELRRRVMAAVPRRSRRPRLLLYLGMAVAACALFTAVYLHFAGPGGSGGATPDIPGLTAAQPSDNAPVRTYYSATLGATIDNVASFPPPEADWEATPQDFPAHRPELQRPRGIALENGVAYCALAWINAAGRPVDDLFAMRASTQEVLWRISLDENEYFLMQPTVCDTTAYVLVSLDSQPPATVLRALSNGTVLWETEFAHPDKPGAYLVSRPIVRNDVLYLSDNMAHVWKLNRATGERLQLWPLAPNAKRPSAAAHMPAMCGEFLYWLDLDGILHGFELATMTELWTQRVGMPKHTANDLASNAPACDGVRVFVLSDKGRLSAVRLADGKILWQKQTDFGALQSSPAANGSTLCLRVAAGTKSRILAIASDTGATLWHHDVDNALSHDTLVMTNNAVLTGNRFAMGAAENPKYTDQLLALRLSDGTPLWTHDWEKAPSRHGAPCVEAGSIFVPNPYGGIDRLLTK